MSRQRVMDEQRIKEYMLSQERTEVELRVIESCARFALELRFPGSSVPVVKRQRKAKELPAGGTA